MQVINIMPILWFVSIGVIWGYTAIISAKIIALFSAKHSSEAKELLPPPGWRDPKLVFFLLKKTTAMQFSGDKQFIRLRRKFVQLIWISLVWPIFTFILIFITLLILSHYDNA